MSPTGRLPLPRRTLLAAAGLALPAIARAAPPPLTLAVGAAAGSPADRRARAFAPFLERHLPGIRLAVANLPGDAGLALLRLLDDAPPGRVLAWLASPGLAARGVERPAFAEAAARLALVGTVQREPVLFAARPALPSFDDLLRRAAGAPLGTPASGSAPHLAALQLQASSGRALDIVAFPSAAAAREALLSGTLAAAALPRGAAIARHRPGGAEPGVLFDIADLTPGALEAAAEPALAALGAIHRGLAVHAATEPATRARLRAALAAVAADPEYAALAAAAGFAPEALDSAAWADHLTAQRRILAPLWRATPWRGGVIG